MSSKEMLIQGLLNVILSQTPENTISCLRINISI
jgi:hypothetical protein